MRLATPRAGLGGRGTRARERGTGGDAAADWAAPCEEVALSLPDGVTPRTLAGLGASTDGTRRLGSAIRFFDRELGPRGWDLDEDRTWVATWSGDGELVVRRGGVAQAFAVRGDCSLPVEEAAADLLGAPRVRPRVKRVFREPVAPAAPGMRRPGRPNSITSA